MCERLASSWSLALLAVDASTRLPVRGAFASPASLVSPTRAGQALLVFQNMRDACRSRQVYWTNATRMHTYAPVSRDDPCHHDQWWLLLGKRGIATVGVMGRVGRGANDPGSGALYTSIAEAVFFPGNVQTGGAAASKLLEAQATGVAQHHVHGPSVTPVGSHRGRAGCADAARCRAVSADPSRGGLQKGIRHQMGQGGAVDGDVGIGIWLGGGDKGSRADGGSPLWDCDGGRVARIAIAIALLHVRVQMALPLFLRTG